MTKKKKIINSIELKYEVSLPMKLNQRIKCYIKTTRNQKPYRTAQVRIGATKTREGKKTVNHFISSQR